jgi:hypothetical protein
MTFVYFSFKTGTLSLPGTKKPVKGVHVLSSWILTVLVLNEPSWIVNRFTFPV